MSLDRSWRRGRPLSKAAEEIATKLEQGELAQPRQLLDPNSGGLKMLTDVLDNAEEVIPQIQAVQDQLSQLITGAQRTADLRAQAEIILLGRLQSGALSAIGYPVPPEQGTAPTVVPTVMFQPDFVDWSRSRLAGAGAAYHLVRVVTPRQLGDVDAPRS